VSGSGERNLGFLFGGLGALLLVVAGVLDFFGAFVSIALGFGHPALGLFTRSVIDVIVGLLVGLFALYGRSVDRDRTFSAGVVLIVLAVVGWFGLGLGADIVGLLGALFALIGGILYVLSRR